MYAHLPGKDFLGYEGIHILGAVMMFTGLFLFPYRKFLERKIIQFLGKLSYWIYLIHIPILFSLSAYVFGLLYRKVSYGISLILTYVITIGVVLILAVALDKILGKEFNKVTSYIMNFLRERKPEC